MGSRRQGGQICRYKDTPKSSLNPLQINPTHWENLARDRPTDLEEESEDMRCDLWGHRNPSPNLSLTPANHNFAQYSTPMHNHFQRILGVTGHTGLESDFLDNCASQAALIGVRPPASPRPLRRLLTLTILLNAHFHHTPPPPSPPLVLLLLLLLHPLHLLLLLLLHHCINDGRSGGHLAHHPLP
nr:unnamed protein product [Spirometra erinaceieuropaei]